MTKLPNLSYYRSILLKLAQLPEEELWMAQGLQDELEPFWKAARASWTEHLPELLEPRSKPDMTPWEGVKPFDPEALQGLKELGD